MLLRFQLFFLFPPYLTFITSRISDKFMVQNVWITKFTHLRLSTHSSDEFVNCLYAFFLGYTEYDCLLSIYGTLPIGIFEIIGLYSVYLCVYWL